MLESRLGQIVLAALLCLVLFVPRLALAQGLDEATALDQQVIQLYKHGDFSEALPLAQRALTIQERALGPDHPDVALSLNNLARLYKPKAAMPKPSHCTSGRWRYEKLRSRQPAATALSNWRSLQIEGRYADAEPL